MQAMKYTVRKYTAILAILLAAVSCNNYLDIVPNDGIATLDMAFNMRSQAIKYLGTCYQYLNGITAGDVDYEGFSAGDEIFVIQSQIGNRYWSPKCAQIAMGLQNVSSVYANDFIRLYQAIRYCNTLVEEVDQVPDMEVWEKEQWKAEAKVLKAFFLFHLCRKWGPIPIVRENLPVSADMETSRVYRDNIDDCFDYMLELIDEALPALYDRPFSLEEYGRVTKPIAATLKAKIAVTAASPLFNGNDEMSGLVDKRGVQLFPSKSEGQKAARWQAALKACEDAVSICENASIKLYEYSGSFRGDEHLTRELTLREVICEDFNDEVIWANTQLGTNKSLQRFTAVNTAADKYPDLQYFYPGFCSVPMKIVDMFYTSRGIPVENDPLRQNLDPEQLRTATDAEEERWYIQLDYTTAEFNYDREPRFYADLAFDGSYWRSSLDNDQTPSDLCIVRKQLNGGTRTGYSIKKLAKHSQAVYSASSAAVTTYTYPFLRLADLYLLYAEAINEVEGPNGTHSAVLFEKLDAIRTRAGIPGVKEAWDSYSDHPGKYATQAGMREIIRRERGIELAFEGERFWDIRRWKTAPVEYAKNVYGWDDTNIGTRSKYYQKTLLSETSFVLKDYFWPFSTSILENNPNLVQNLGWK
jgi:hypothetical protein